MSHRLCGHCQKPAADSECTKCGALYCSESCFSDSYKHKVLRGGSCKDSVFVGEQDDKQLVWKRNRDFLEGWTVVRTIGTGAYGSVWLYENDNTHEKVAVKYIYEEEELGNDITRLTVLSSSPECSRYVVCYEDHALVPHPETTDNSYVYAIRMGFVQGPTLDSLKVPTDERHIVVRKLLRNALRALEYVHSKDIVHGDIKPENLIVRENTNDVVIIDFGLACQPPCEGDAAAGSSDYMSPEQLEETGPRSKAADIFSLGASFFFLVLGEDKPSREAELKKMDRDTPRPYPFIPWSKTGISADYEEYKMAMGKLNVFTDARNHTYGRVISKMLAWKPEDRPSAAEALEFL